MSGSLPPRNCAALWTAFAHWRSRRLFPKKKPRAATGDRAACFSSFSEALLAKLRRESFSLFGERVPTLGYVKVSGGSVIRCGFGALHGPSGQVTVTLDPVPMPPRVPILATRHNPNSAGL